MIPVKSLIPKINEYLPPEIRVFGKLTFLFFIFYYFFLTLCLPLLSFFPFLFPLSPSSSLPNFTTCIPFYSYLHQFLKLVLFFFCFLPISLIPFFLLIFFPLSFPSSSFPDPALFTNRLL